MPKWLSRACLIVMSWNLSCHFLFRRVAHKETINNIFVLSRRCVIVNTLFTQCIVSCRMVSSFRHICDHCCFSMPSLIALVRTINIHYKSQCFKRQMSRFIYAPLHLTQKTQSSNSGSKVKDKKYWFSKHEDKYQRELINYYRVLGSVYEKKTLHKNWYIRIYPFLLSSAIYYGQIVFKPLALIWKSFAKKSVDLYAFQVTGCDPFFYFYIQHAH